MHWLIGNSTQLGEVAAKAALIYVVALVGLRVGQRRTLAQWTIIDFVTAVAIGAIVGRTAIASTQSWLTGATALCVLILIHRVATGVRAHGTLQRWFDHPVRVLVADGMVRDGELRRCGLTRDDVSAHLRQNGVFDVADLRYVLYEAKGGLTIVPMSATADPLVDQALDGSVCFSERTGRS